MSFRIRFEIFVRRMLLSSFGIDAQNKNRSEIYDGVPLWASHGSVGRANVLLAVTALSILTSSCGGGSSSTGGGGSSSEPPPADFSISASPSSAVVSPGGALVAQVSVTAVNGFSSSVTVSVTGLTTGVTVSPSSPFMMSPGSQNITITVPSNVAQGNFTVGLQASSGSLQHSSNVAIQVKTQALASFAISLSNNELSFSQRSGANTGVGISIISGGNPNYEVQFSVTGLPSGVQATFGENPFPVGLPTTLLTLTANSTALSNYAPITVIATRTIDGVQQSAQFLLNVTPPVGTLPAIRTDFIREDGTPAAALYDAVHNVLYASNTQWNRVDVISPTTHQILNSIPAPSPTGMDMTSDGKHLIVTSNVQQIVSIDTTSLQIVQRTSVPVQTGNASSKSCPIRDEPEGDVGFQHKMSLEKVAC